MLPTPQIRDAIYAHSGDSGISVLILERW
jgi:hypothetical protein